MNSAYDVGARGERFVMVQTVDTEPVSLVVVQNRTSGLERVISTASP